MKDIFPQNLMNDLICDKLKEVANLNIIIKQINYLKNGETFTILVNIL